MCREHHGPWRSRARPPRTRPHSALADRSGVQLTLGNPVSPFHPSWIGRGFTIHGHFLPEAPVNIDCAEKGDGLRQVIETQLVGKHTPARDQSPLRPGPPPDRCTVRGLEHVFPPEVHCQLSGTTAPGADGEGHGVLSTVSMIHPLGDLLPKLVLNGRPLRNCDYWSQPGKLGILLLQGNTAPYRKCFLSHIRVSDYHQKTL